MITPFGVWILVKGKEYFLRHRDFPWFHGASVKDVMDVKMPRVGHLSWPKLDVDLHVDSIENPEAFPLVALQNRSQALTQKKIRRSA